MAKYTYITLIFIANLLLLAHVIPHHHHSGTPHFILFDTHSHNGDEDDCCCNHENGQTCLFEQNIDAVYEHSDEDSLGASSVLHQHPELFLQVTAYSVFIYDFSLIRETVTFLESPCLISYYCDYAGSVLGLRAPPIFTINQLI